MSKIDDALRIKWTEVIEKFLVDKGEEVLHEKDNILWVPCTDAEGNDKWVKFNIQVPTKVTDDDDGYAKQAEYELKKAERAEKAKADAEKKAKKIAADKAKRAAAKEE